jgi:hypothetical protein
MRAKKIILLLCVSALLFTPALFAQDQDQQNQVEQVGEPNAEELGTDTAQQKLRTVSVSKFEDAGFWGVNMPLDQGLIQHRTLPGSPADKETLEGEVEAGIEVNDNNVLGVKVNFYRRGHNSFSVMPVKPLPVEGIAKTISVWVVGRNSPHTLKLLISDQFGNDGEITMGELNFTGWKKMTVAIPPSIKQKDYHYQNRMGIKIDGFKIECDPEETYGTYYIYFDGLRATTDLFAEETRDVDDMADTW